MHVAAHLLPGHHKSGPVGAEHRIRRVVEVVFRLIARGLDDLRCIVAGTVAVQNMGGSFDPPETGADGDTTLLTGTAPASTMRSYPMEVVGYTRGRGHLTLTLDGYRPCHNAAEVIEAAGYEPEHDLDNPADSVFWISFMARPTLSEGSSSRKAYHGSSSWVLWIWSAIIRPCRTAR